MGSDERSTSVWAVRPRPSLEARTPQLVWVGGAAERTIALAMRETLVGRASECEIQPPVRGVSRRHAKIIVTPTVVSVVDLQSRNGTFLNGVRTDVAELAEGDELHFGPLAHYRFERARRDAAAASSAIEIEGFPALSAREREVAALAAEGLTNAAIAAALAIRPRTVATHLEHIFAKLGLASRAELIRAFAKRAARRGA